MNGKKWLTSLLWAALLVLTGPAVAGTTFTDNFSRSNGPVGNGWTSIGTNCLGPVMEIRSQRATVVPGSGTGGGDYCWGYEANIVRDVSFSESVTISATVESDMSFFGIGFNSADPAWMWGGLQLLILRDVNGQGRSAVYLYRDGLSVGPPQFAPVQFRSTHSVTVTFDMERGEVYGSVTSGSQVFRFYSKINNTSLAKSNVTVRQRSLGSTVDNLKVVTDDLPCGKLPSGLNTCDLEPGDVLVLLNKEWTSGGLSAARLLV